MTQTNSQKIYPISNTDWVQNIASTEIPVFVKKTLALGPNFAPPTKCCKNLIPKLITDLEYIHRDESLIVNDEERELSRQKLSNIITNHLHQPPSSFSQFSPQFHKDISHTHTFLKSHTDLVITRADKGNKTVIMDRTDYDHKLNLLLADKTTYEPTKNNKDPTPSLICKFNKSLQHLRNTKQIDYKTYRSLISYNSQAPRCYGLPKTHKSDYPLRPIISNINSPSSNLSKFLLPPLQTLSHDNPYDIKNSHALKDLLKTIHIPPNFILASFDAESLFTNIPINIALQIIKDNWDTIKPHTTLSSTSFLESLSLCCNSGYFSSQGTFYNQIAGLAMGNSLAPDISNIVLNDLLNKTTPLFPHDILMIKKYVDDLFLIINPEKIPEILASFNSYHPRLKFTVETETNNSLPFLDLLLTRNPDGYISFDWYTKPTYSGRILHFHSSHPYHQRLNVAKNLIKRALTLSDPIHHEKNTTILSNILKSNGFPKKLIKKLLQNTVIHPPPITLPTPPYPSQYRSLPYIPNLTDKIKKSLKKYFPNLKLGLSTTNKLHHIYTKLKDTIPQENKHNVIYRIPCATPNCNSSYIGQTKNPVHKRLKQHKTDIKNKEEKTALSRHATIEGHTFDFNNFTILGTETNHEKRLLSESIYIHLDSKPLNDKMDKEFISSTYKNIFDILKNNN